MSFASAARADSGSANFLVGDLQAGRELIQTFIAAEDGLRMVNVRLATYDRRNVCSLHIQLIESATAKTLAERFLQCENLQDNHAIPLTFAPVADSKGKEYQLRLSSPDGKPQHAIAAWARSIAQLDGRLYFDGRMIAGELLIEVDYGSYAAHWRRVAQLAALFLGLLGAGLAGWWAARRRRWSLTHQLDWRQALWASLHAHWRELAVLLLVFVLYLLATPYGSFADEYDNIVGGRSITAGRLPHVAFFVHHLLLPYFLAAPIAWLTGGDLWAFRAIVVFLLYLWSLGIYVLFTRSISRTAGLLYLILIAISLPVYWGHMLLAETLIGPAVVSLCLIFMGQHRTGGIIGLGTTVLVSALLALIMLSSLGYGPLALFLAVVFGLLWLRQPRCGRRPARLLATVALLAAPYLLLSALLLGTGSTRAFIFDNIVFNAVYYARFRPEIHTNPVTTLVTMTSAALTHAEGLLYGRADATNPQAIFSFLAVASLIVNLLSRRQYGILTCFIPVIIFLQPRGGIGQGWLDNVHIAPFVVVSIMAASIALPSLGGLALGGAVGWAKIAYYALGLAMLAVTLNCLAFSTRLYAAYLSREPVPLIAEGPPSVSTIVNDLTTPDDYVWVGPFDHEALMYLEARPASYFVYVLPWVGACDECQDRILRDWMTTKPKIVVWDPGTTIGGYNIDDYTQRIHAFLAQHYFVVQDSKGGRLRNFYFLGERAEGIMAELRAKGYLE